MLVYKLCFYKSVEKDLKYFPGHVKSRLLEKLSILTITPRPHQTTKVQGKYSHLYRVRIGGYRIVYSVDDKEKTVTIVNIDHRKQVYR